jgi:hypothetical protein
VPRFPRGPLALSLALGLLLVALGGGATLGATGNTDSFRLVPTASPHAIPGSSCHGPHACDGATGTIGKNACNGFYACQGATGNIAHNSCNGAVACGSAAGNVGRNACNNDNACENAAGNVGRNACNDANACRLAGGNVGSNACDGYAACNATAGNVGNHACNGLQACYIVGGDIGDNACNRYEACFVAARNVGKYACNGYRACISASAAIPDCADNLPGHVPAPCYGTRSVMGSSEFPNVSNLPVDVWATVIARYPVVGKPRGTFQFRLDGQPLGSPVAIDSHGRANIRLNLRPGIHWVTGRYQGDATFSSSVPVARLYQYVLAQ